MKVLHICNDFFGSPIYDRIFSELDNLGVEQKIFVFLRKDQERLIREEHDVLIEKHSPIMVHLNLLQSNIGRVFPAVRNRRLLNVISNKVDIQSFDLIHAHTVYSNGSLARRIHRMSGIPYVLSVRNTDVNTAFKYFIHLRKAAFKTLVNAQKTIFLNPVHQKLTMERLSQGSSHMLNHCNALVIPNPINEQWFVNLGSPKSISGKSTINVLFVGELSPNKNIEFLLKVFADNWLSGIKFNVNIIGQIKQNKEGINYAHQVQERIRNQSNAQYLGEVRDFDQLRNNYREADIFFMVSKLETFGLVYIEAMTQGTPLIYTKEQGIDGFFPDGSVGFSCLPNDVKYARKCVAKLKGDYGQISKNCLNFSQKFESKAMVKKLYQAYIESVEL